MCDGRIGGHQNADLMKENGTMPRKSWKVSGREKFEDAGAWAWGWGKGNGVGPVLFTTPPHPWNPKE